METQNARFTVNADGTVTDHRTRLIWTQATLAKDINYDAAEKAIAELGEGWRIPTTNEALTLVDRTRHSPAIDTSVFPDTENDWYWTKDRCAWAPESAVWVVDFDDGDVNSLRRYNYACLRACRELPASQ